MAIDVDFSGPAQVDVDIAAQDDLEVDLLPQHRIGQHVDFDDSDTTAGYAITRKADGTFDMQPGGGGGAVDSVFGRTGVVAAVASDYDASLIDNDSVVVGAFVDDALNTLQTLVNNAQGQSVNLDDLSSLAQVNANEIMVGASLGVYAYQSGATARTSLGVAIGTDVMAYESYASLAANLDHGTFDGLTDDDHTQYPLLLGRSGGQTIIGGTASGEDLILESTSNASKGTVQVKDDLEMRAGSDILLYSNADVDHIKIAGQGSLSASQTITIPNTLGTAHDFVLSGLAQTLTNKTLTAPTISSFTNAQHDHSDAANGGTITAPAPDSDTWPLLAMTRYSDTTAIPNGSYTDVRWATNGLELNDYPFTLSGGGTANDEDTITLPEAGTYEVCAEVGWTNATGNGDMTLSLTMAGSGGTMYGSPTILEEGQSSRSCSIGSVWTVVTTGAATTLKLQIKYTNNNSSLAASIGGLRIKRIA